MADKKTRKCNFTKRPAIGLACEVRTSDRTGDGRVIGHLQLDKKKRDGLQAIVIVVRRWRPRAGQRLDAHKLTGLIRQALNGHGR